MPECVRPTCLDSQSHQTEMTVTHPDYCFQKFSPATNSPASGTGFFKILSRLPAGYPLGLGFNGNPLRNHLLLKTKHPIENQDCWALDKAWVRDDIILTTTPLGSSSKKAGVDRKRDYLQFNAINLPIASRIDHADRKVVDFSTLTLKFE